MMQGEGNLTRTATPRSNESLEAKKKRKFMASQPEEYLEREREGDRKREACKRAKETSQNGEKSRKRMARNRATPGLIESKMTQEEENITQTATTRPNESVEAKKKRKFRGSQSEDYHKRERERSRKRMARNRAKTKAQKRALELRKLLLLSEDDVKKIDARVDRQRELLICDWFDSRNLRFHPKDLKDPRKLNRFIPKQDWHEIDLQVAEFEVSIILEVGGTGNNQDINKLESKGNKVKLIEKINVKIHNKLDPKIGRRILADEVASIDSTATQKLSHSEQQGMANDKINFKLLNKLVLKRIIADEVTSIDPTATKKLRHSEKHSMTNDEINVKILNKLGLKQGQGIIADEVTSIDSTTAQKLSHSEQQGMTKNELGVLLKMVADHRSVSDEYTTDPSMSMKK